jgi:hypothetical protein
MRTLVTGLAVLLLATSGTGASGSSGSGDDKARRRNQVIAPAVRLPLVFIENRGQFDEEIHYQVRIPGIAVAVHRDGWSIRGESQVRLRFEGASEEATVQGRERLETTANYLFGGPGEDGDEMPGWIQGVETYERVHVADVRPGMDLDLYESSGRIEYDVRLDPGVSVEEVVFRFEGAEESRIAEDGGLVVRLGETELRQRPPSTWQVERDGTRRELSSAFRALGDDRYGFSVQGRDPELALVIDPVLVYSELIGGSNADVASGVALDETGSVYVTGWAKSSNFPRAVGRSKGKDVVVFKLDATGTRLEYATFVGGSGNEEGLAIAVTPEGEAVVVGETGSSNFPHTRDAYARSRSGNADAFAFKLSDDGSELLWSTFLGGSSDDVANDVVLGPDGSSYVVGTTRSRDFPVTSHAYQTERGGARDAFVTRLGSDGMVLVYSTYLGGVRDDGGHGIALDGNGNAYVTGRTDSADFPTTTGALDNRKSDVDAFVSKLSQAGGNLIYSTFLGGDGQDEAYGIALDVEYQAWVVGWTQSDDFPTTDGALQESNRARRDGFATRISTSGATLTYSTYVGGSGHDEVVGLALDAYGTPWLSGTTTSDDLPVTPDASQESRSGGRDGFLLGVDGETGRLGFGTYLGGAGHDAALAVGSQPLSENVVVVGNAENIAPSDRGPFSGNKLGPSDALVARFEPGICGSRAELSELGAGAGVQLRSTTPRLGKPYTLSVYGAPPNTPGFVLVSDPTASATLLEGIMELHVDRATARVLFRFTTDDDGAWEFETTLPHGDGLCGRSVVLQAVTLGHELGPLSFGQVSQGLFLTFGD